MKKPTESPRVSDEALVRATGRNWTEWCRLLDGAGAATMKHGDIATMVHEKFNGGPWWSQMVAVGYEQLRGLRVVHQKAGGFEVSRTKTITAPIGRVYRAWHSPATRRKWLADPALSFSTANENKSLRFTWIDGKTRAAADFLDKGDRTAVTVTHSKLKDAKAAEKMKKYWGEQLDKLAGHFATV